MKLAFVGNGEPSSILFNLWKHQTPDCTGKWAQLQAVPELKDADIFCVIDRLPTNLGIDLKKCIFLGAHPETMPHIYSDMSNLDCLAKIDCKHEVAFLEWWLDFDYDYLKALKPPTKTKPLGCVMTDRETNISHTLRKAWMKRFTSRDNLLFDLHGRLHPSTHGMQRYYRGHCGDREGRGYAASGVNHMPGKENVYLEHKYMLEFDVLGQNYFSERILDCMLLWAMPIYYGCPNLEKYLPQDSFRRLDINGDGEDVLNIISSDFYEEHLSDLAKARDILLDELQLFPRIHKLVFGTNR